MEFQFHSTMQCIYVMAGSTVRAVIQEPSLGLSSKITGEIFSKTHSQDWLFGVVDNEVNHEKYHWNAIWAIQHQD